MKKRALFILGLLLMFLWVAAPVLAHRVIVFAWVEKEMIHVQGSFGANRPAKGCEIQVVTPQGTLVHQGVTDQKGEYSLKLEGLPDSDLMVILNAGTGHSGQWTLPKGELQPEPALQDRSDNRSENPAEKLAAKLAEKQALEQGPPLARILAGIALIFALAAGVAWVQKRKRKNV